MTEAKLNRLERYEIRERLGAGGMARVYRAWDTHLERLVAIKILHEHLADDDTFKERFEREAKFIASLNHPNIVQVYDYKATERDGFPLYYMVMSYVEGKTLRQVLEEAANARQPLSHAEVLHYTHNLCDALGYAHERGMVHRDVKPGNVILNARGDAILTDFGIARMVATSRLTQDGVSTGTPAYMSPEQANGDPGDARSDLYSLATIVFEMLTGHTPFTDDGTLSIMYKQLNAPIPAISERLQQPNPQLDAFMKRALAKNPADRFASAQDFWRTFETILSNPSADVTTILPTGQQPNAPRSQTTSPRLLASITTTVRRNPRTISAGAGVIAVAALVVLAVILINASTARDQAISVPTIAANVPSMTGSVYFTSRFNPDSSTDAMYWSQTSGDMVTRTITQDGIYQLQNLRPFVAETSIVSTNTRYSNVSVAMEGLLDATSDPASAYGIVFRYQDDANYNVFAVDGLARFSIWALENGAWRELRGVDEEWTPTDAARPVGEMNKLSVTIIGDFVSGYVNNRQVVRVEETTFTDGGLGIYFATDAGEATVLIDEYRVFQSVPSMTGSRP